MEDFRPNCDFCGKKLNKNGLKHYFKTQEKLCKKCFTWFKKTLKKHNFKINTKEEY